MPELVAPTARVHRSFLAAMEEFQAEGRGRPADASMIGHEIREHGQAWDDPAEFEVFVAQLRANALEETPRPPHIVPQTTLWFVESDQYLARISIRHRLNEKLSVVGGHIGYDVRPSARRRGYATAMLRAALPIAHALGIDKALLTCDSDNLASRRVIEVCGGVLADERDGVRRYWVPTD
jgi:predicted acetyltransferase